MRQALAALLIAVAVAGCASKSQPVKDAPPPTALVEAKSDYAGVVFLLAAARRHGGMTAQAFLDFDTRRGRVRAVIDLAEKLVKARYDDAMRYVQLAHDMAARLKTGFNGWAVKHNWPDGLRG